MRLGPPTSNSPAGNPCSERSQQTHHSVGTPSVHPLLPQRAQRNGTTSQLNTYLLRYNIFLLTAFCQALLQGHILAITNPNAPTVLSPLLTPPSSAGPENAQQRLMRVHFLIAMGQYQPSKDESDELLYQHIYVVFTTQELRHSN